MKKFAFSLIAGLALIQASFAATSALTESLLEYEAITTAIGTNPSFQNVIPPTEFIVDIKRITRQIDNLGQVQYEIVTKTVTANTVGPEGIDASHSHDKSHHHNRSTIHRYIATLEVTANPGIGPNIVTVVSITPSTTRHHH